MWPIDVVDVLRRHTEIQDYGRVWKIILSIYFPSKRGFRISPSSDPKLKRVWVVRKALDVVLVLHWAPPTRDAFVKAERAMIHSAQERVSQRVAVVVRTVGSYVTSYGIDSHTTRREGSFKDRCWEPQGQDILRSAFVQTWMDCKVPGFHEAEKDLEFDYLLEFLEEAPKPKRRGRRNGETDSPYQFKRRTGHSTTNEWGATTLMAPFRDSFPLDIVLMFLDYLSYEDIFAFSLVNSACNRVANRRIWRAYRLKWDERDTPQSLEQRFEALSRIPHRSRNVEQLTVCCGWAWDPARLEQFARGLRAMTKLKTLRLLDGAGTTMGGEHEPLFRFLTDRICSSDSDSQIPLRLEVFEFDGVITDVSPVYEFLRAQPSIRHLTGMALYDGSRTLKAPSADILPNLEGVCTDSVPALQHWLPGRPVHSVSFTTCFHANNVHHYPVRPGYPYQRGMNEVSIDSDIVSQLLHCLELSSVPLTRFRSTWDRIIFLPLLRDSNPSVFSNITHLELPMETLGFKTDASLSLVANWPSLRSLHIRSLPGPRPWSATKEELEQWEGEEEQQTCEHLKRCSTTLRQVTLHRDRFRDYGRIVKVLWTRDEREDWHAHRVLRPPYPEELAR